MGERRVKSECFFPAASKRELARNFRKVLKNNIYYSKIPQSLRLRDF